MKIRTDFVTNSSSSSFIFKEDCTDKIQKQMVDRLWDEMGKSVEYSELGQNRGKDYQCLLSWGQCICLERIRDHSGNVIEEVNGWYQEEVYEKIFPDYKAYQEKMEEISERLRGSYKKEQEEQSALTKEYAQSLAGRISDEAWLRFSGNLFIEFYYSVQYYPWKKFQKNQRDPKSEVWISDMLEEILIAYASEGWWADDRMFRYELATQNFQRIWEASQAFDGVPIGEMLEYVLDAKYMYCDDMETHYLIARIIEDMPECRFGCSHMG